VTWKGVTRRLSGGLLVEERPPPRNQIKTIEQNFRGDQEEGKERRKEKLKEEGHHRLKLPTGRTRIVLRFLSTKEPSTSTKKLTRLSSEVLLSLAGWIRSFDNRSKVAGGIIDRRCTGKYPQQFC